ncbi:MAG TPA: hypothetical protein VHA56_22020 [Mucilaginibacter sp.]|nr:hypothetical protein [Mucilaginibacter sp.]
MKKLILIASFILGINFMASAQKVQKSPEQRAAHRAKALQKYLGLNQEQTTQVNAAFVTMASRMDSLKNNKSADKKANKLAVRTIKLDTKKQVVAVLNDEQKQKFAAFEKKRRHHHNKGREMRKESTEG